MQEAKRVVLNTVFLYGKMLISMFIALISTRIVLNALGVDDFGIFNLVAGVIAMLSFLNAAMAVSTQRYLSFYLGVNDKQKLNSIFKSSVVLHLLIGILVVVVMEVAGMFLFDGFFNIAQDRIPTAKLVYHFMVVSTFFTINAVPYDAAIITHEKLLFESVVGVLESALKLAIAIVLTISVKNDRLILYGVLMAALTIVIRIIKSVYCYREFSECKSYRQSALKISLIKEMFSFAGWNMFGALCGIGRSQGLAIILNLFFGTVVNAAYGIANQVNGQLAAFSQNMLKALNPQIIKSEGRGERQKMLLLAMMACKYGFFLMAFFSIPIIFEMPYILKLWLKIVPDYTIVFCQLALLATLVNQLTIGLQTALQATGKIKVYQSIVGSLLLFNLPISWILLKLGMPAYSVLISMIFIEMMACLIRIILLKQIGALKIREYFNKVILRIIIPCTFTCCVALIPHTFCDMGFLRFGLVIIVSSLTFVTSFYFTGIDVGERVQINKALLQVKSKFSNNRYREQYS
ncbi:lipopolysaccharide biosynthesis protein [Marinifilum sp.]|uniref:lipopolysaccharide biosynthesis protein n=1 Tax=Marinifilum sp. TaxID=2033137 RepID=UPI003BA8D980